jgi:predicted metal-dependent hydrolase
MSAWYRAYLKEAIPSLIEKWEQVLGVTVVEWGIKQMKTKWGTCNIEAGRVWLNLELAKKSPRCLEYIVVHEMMHLLERHHNDRFRGLMNKYYPQWQLIRDELNREPLAHEDWAY